VTKPRLGSPRVWQRWWRTSPGVIGALSTISRAATIPAPGSLKWNVPPSPSHRTALPPGPVVSEDSDVFGRTVNIAARIAAQAEAGEVLTSEQTAALVDDARLRFERVGPVGLKGLADPVTLYRVLRNGAG
jgi:class 3 adenylate cyclase